MYRKVTEFREYFQDFKFWFTKVDKSIKMMFNK